MKVSVIVPVYNVEPYLEKCIFSLMNQTYSNIEILLIDDGSTDKSGKICDEWCKRDNRIKVYHNKNNGVSNARNCGIRNSCGDYITFVDSDDWVDRCYIQKLIEVTVVKYYDLVICRYFTEDFVRGKIKEHRLSEELKGEFLEDYYNILNFIGGPVFKLYKSEIIKKNKIFFPEDMSYSEDRVFNHKYYHYVKEYMFVDEPLYYYASRNNNSLSKIRSYKNYIAAISEFSLLSAFCDEHNVTKKDLILGDAVVNTVVDFAGCLVAGSYDEFKNKVLCLRGLVLHKSLSFSNKKKRRIYRFFQSNMLIFLYFYLISKALRNRLRIQLNRIRS